VTDIKIHRPQIQSARAKVSNSTSNPVDTRKYIPKEVSDFAASMESQFSELMLKEMQKTSQSSTSNSAEEFYNGMLLQERAKSMTEQSNRGLKDLILDEVYPQYKRTAANFEIYENQKQQFNKQKVQMHEGPTQPSVTKHESANTGVIYE